MSASAPVTFSTTRTHIAGIPVSDLARQFGTPTFIYDAAMILRRLADLAAFDHVRYAQKACSNLAVLDLLRRHGALVDAVSAGEIRRALAAGYTIEGTPPPIIYTADIFDAEALDLCVEHGIHVNCGSPDMIEHLGRRAPGRQITLRINPGFGHGHSRKTNTGGDQAKHGIWHEQIGLCLEMAARHQIVISGLHSHIGSGTDLAHLSQVCAAMEKAVLAVGPAITSISAGGGLPTVYRPGDVYVDLAAYFTLWDAVRKRLEDRFGHAVGLEIEPGRYLVAESGYLVAEIRAVKRQGEHCFYLLDAGFNNLARPILYGAYHPMSIVPRDSVARRARARGDRGRSVVRVGRHFHAVGRRLRRPPHVARGRSGAALGDRVRRGLRVRDGFELQLAAVCRRSAHSGRPRPPGPPPADVRGPDPRGDHPGGGAVSCCRLRGVR